MMVQKWWKYLVVLFITVCLSSFEAFAGGTTYTWTGGTTDWNTASNWSPSGGPPTSADAAIIPTGLGNYPIITTGTVTVKDVNIDVIGSLTITGGTFDALGAIDFLATTSPYGTITQSGGTINITKELKFTGAGTFNQSGSSLLTCDDDYINSGGGTFNSTGGTIQFTGSGKNADFSTGTNQFFNVIINAGVDPKFDKIPTGQISIRGDFTNNNSTLDVLIAEF